MNVTNVLIETASGSSIVQIRSAVLVDPYGAVRLYAKARSGFQKGLWSSTVKGCIGNLRPHQEDWEDLVQEVYGVSHNAVRGGF